MACLCRCKGIDQECAIEVFCLMSGSISGYSLCKTQGDGYLNGLKVCFSEFIVQCTSYIAKLFEQQVRGHHLQVYRSSHSVYIPSVSRHDLVSRLRSSSASTFSLSILSCGHFSTTWEPPRLLSIQHPTANLDASPLLERDLTLEKRKSKLYSQAEHKALRQAAQKILDATTPDDLILFVGNSGRYVINFLPSIYLEKLMWNFIRYFFPALDIDARHIVLIPMSKTKTPKTSLLRLVSN
jgi:hypothetical protein